MTELLRQRELGRVDTWVEVDHTCHAEVSPTSPANISVYLFNPVEGV